MEVATCGTGGADRGHSRTSLMVGFTAQWQSGEIDIDPAEILDADGSRATS